jgi:hypothetical protein
MLITSHPWRCVTPRVIIATIAWQRRLVRVLPRNFCDDMVKPWDASPPSEQRRTYSPKVRDVSAAPVDQSVRRQQPIHPHSDTSCPRICVMPSANRVMKNWSSFLRQHSMRQSGGADCREVSGRKRHHRLNVHQSRRRNGCLRLINADA